MRFRKLRIAWSVVWGIACVLLIVMWVRSHYWVEQVFVPIGGCMYFVSGSTPNTFGGGVTDQSPTGTWGKFSMATTDWLEAIFVDNGTPFSTAPVWSFDGTSVMMPYWFGLVVTSILSVLPWIRRYSLRTLLIATTLVALVLGLIVCAAR
jgi:hypothetical protein